MTTYRFAWRSMRVLDFDCEARPLSFLGQDFVTKELTAIAAKFIGEKEMHSWVLGEDTLEDMLLKFRLLYDSADMVTGHNLIRYDLPLVNAMSLECGLAPLKPVLCQDTYLHLKRRQGVSASQESLAAMLDVPAPKVQMGQVAWREANRLLPEGLVKTRARAVGDVRQHILMRAELLKRDWLRSPRRWNP